MMLLAAGAVDTIDARWQRGSVVEVEGGADQALGRTQVLDVSGALRVQRDRFGHGPVYWAERGGVLWVGDHAETLALRLGLSLDPARWLARLAAQESDTTGTLWRGLSRLPPGWQLNWSLQDGVRLSPPAVLEPDPDALELSPRQLGELLVARLEDALARRIRADTALAFSGGFDSSALLTLAHQRGVVPLSLAFEHRGSDESAEQSAVLGALGIRGVRVPVAGVSLWQGLDDIAFAPVRTHAWGVALYEAAARRGCKTVLSGFGGDEAVSLGLEGVHQAWHEGARLTALWRAAWLGLRYRHGDARSPMRRVLSRWRGVAVPAGHTWRPPVGFTKAARQQFCQLRFDHVPIGAVARQRHALEHPYLVLSLEGQVALAARAGVRFEVPFLDEAFVRASMAVPIGLRQRRGRDRYLFRQALGDRLPRSARNRTGKADLSPAFHQALRRQGPVWLPALKLGLARFSGWLDRSRVERLADAYLSGGLTEAGPYLHRLVWATRQLERLDLCLPEAREWD